MVVEKCGSQFGGKDRSLEQEFPQGKAWRAYAGEGESITARGERCCWAASGGAPLPLLGLHETLACVVSNNPHLPGSNR